MLEAFASLTAFNRGVIVGGGLVALIVAAIAIGLFIHAREYRQDSRRGK